MKVAGRIFRVVVSAFCIAGTVVVGQVSKSTVEETVKIVKEWADNNKAACASYVVDTYITVLSNERGFGYLDQSVIDSQMAVLNAAFAPMGFRFSHTIRDTTDVYNNVVENPMVEMDIYDGTMRYLYHRGGLHNLNIYFHPNTVSRGWATSSSESATVSGRDRVDGVVVSTSTVPGGSDKNYNAGDTLVNLVGRWLGLLPTFSATINPGEGRPCVGVGDGVDDTPKQATQFSGNNTCEIGADSCPADAGVDPIHNYMSDSTDACRSSFTAGQKAFAQALWDTYRNPSCGPTTCCASPVAPVAPITPPVAAPAPAPPVAAPAPALSFSSFSGANFVIVPWKS